MDESTSLCIGTKHYLFIRVVYFIVGYYVEYLDFYMSTIWDSQLLELIFPYQKLHKENTKEKS